MGILPLLTVEGPRLNHLGLPYYHRHSTISSQAITHDQDQYIWTAYTAATEALRRS